MADAPVRVLVVDDSVVIRRVVTEVLSGDPDIEVVGTAPNGRIALSKIAQLRPDLITLDVEMPIMDGLETLRAVRASGLRTPIIMFSTLTERGASATMDALLSGANDYVTKPANVGSMKAAVAAVSAELLPRVKALCARTATTSTTATAHAAPAASVAPIAPLTTAPTRDARPATAARATRVDLLVIGVSTGGPNALAAMLPQLPANLPVPVVVVQHMPPTFTKHLAERLDRLCSLPVREAQGGEDLCAGEVWIAPGGRHLAIQRHHRGAVLATNLEPPENSCRPAVDVLFRSAASVFGAHTLGVIMTGMGYDGRRGAANIKSVGGRVIVQDQASSVVWGMPSGPVQDGNADAVVSLDMLSHEIMRSVRRERALTSSARSAK